MKVGDVIFSTKVRPYEKATIIKADVVIKERNNKNGSKKKETRSTYKALYSDAIIVAIGDKDKLKIRKR